MPLSGKELDAAAVATAVATATAGDNVAAYAVVSVDSVDIADAPATVGVRIIRAVVDET